MRHATNIDDYAVNGIMLYTKGDGDVYTGAFVCTSVNISYALNSIPFAQVKVGAGASLFSYSRHQQTPEEILKSVLGKRAVAYSDMVKCELWEAGENTSIRNMKTPLADGGSKKIFDGYIAAAALSYETGGYASKTIMLSIYNKAVALMTVPLGSMENVTSQYLIRMLDAGGNTNQKQDNQTATDIESAGDLDMEEVLIFKEPLNNPSMTLDMRIANIIAKIIYVKSYNATRAEISIGQMPYRQMILDNMFSSYRIDMTPDGIASSTADTTVDEAFDAQFSKSINGTMDGASIYDAISMVALSNTFMLSLCPRFAKDDFKIEICPSKAWDATTPITIPLSKITGMQSNHDPLACVQTPEVFMVHYGDVLAMDTTGEEVYDVGRPGVFAMDPAVMSAFEDIIKGTGNGTAKLEAMSRIFRCQRYAAPSWLLLLAKPPGSRSMIDELKRGGNDLSAEDRDIARNFQIGKAADAVAKALFTHLYGSRDTCSVSLSPELRFGRSGTCLEDHIGDCVDIVFEDDKVSVRGIIDRIQYTYTCGKGQASQSYGLSLARVRPRDPSEPKITCPLYTRA